MSWGKLRRVRFFSISIKKEITKTDKDGKKGVVSISYKIKLIDSPSGKFIIKSC